MEDIKAKVRDIISDQLGVAKEDVSLEKSFLEDLGADSLDLVELIMAFEGEFKLTIPDEESEALKTVGDVVTYIESKKSA